MIDDDLIPVLASLVMEAEPLESYVDERNLVSRDVVLKSVEEGEDPILQYMIANGREPIHSSYLVEDSYVLCNDSAVYVGRFPMETPGEELLKVAGLCSRGFSGAFHTHPIAVHIPTPYDIVDAMQLGQRFECVGVRFSRRCGRILCIAPRSFCSWREIADVLSTKFFDFMLRTVSRYLVVIDDDDSMYFLPHPEGREVLMLEDRFVEMVRGLADVAIVKVSGSEYEVEVYREGVARGGEGICAAWGPRAHAGA